jgi:hypothetical protein
MWNTNFPLWTEGSWSEKVKFWPVNKGEDSVKNLVVKSWETRLPLMATISEGKGTKLPSEKSGVEVSQKGVLVTAFGKNPDGEGTILRLWEQAGNSGKCSITLPEQKSFKTAQCCNLRGEKIGDVFKIQNGKFDLDLKAYAPISIILR